MGRPRNSRNQSRAHKAGGARQGAGRKSKAQIQANASGQQRLTFFQNDSQAARETSDAIENEQHHNHHEEKEEASNEVEQEASNEMEHGESNETAQAEAAISQQSTQQQSTSSQQEQQNIEISNGLSALVQEIGNGVVTNFNNEEADNEPQSADDDDDGNNDGLDYDMAQFSSRAYMPPQGTPLYEYLDKIKTDVSNNPLRKKSGSMWVPPPDDPVAKGIDERGTADAFYISNAWIYLWFVQEKFSIHNHLCVHCGSNDTESEGLSYRPMFWWDKIVWVLHRRHRCLNHNCKGSSRGERRSFASIDPRYLSNLPTKVAERFEFVTTPGGLGIHTSMLHSFSNLIPSQVYTGTFVRMINELHKINYSKTHLSYLDNAVDWDIRNFVVQQGRTTPQPFAPFHSPGYFNGIKLSRTLMQRLHDNFMEKIEPYIQAHTQYHVDEGATGDDTFKFHSHVYVGSKGKSASRPFGAMWTSTNLNGKVSLARFKFTKANSEMEMMMDQWRESRINAGVPELLRFECDNKEAFDSFITRKFSTLQKDVVPYVPNTGVPNASMNDENITYMTTMERADNYADAIIDDITNRDGDIYYGFDAEWKRGAVRSDTPVFTFSFPGVSNVALLHLNSNSLFPQKLKKLLELPKMVACGRQVSGDVRRIHEKGVNIQRLVELENLSRVVNPRIQGTSLKDLCRSFLGLHLVDKNIGQDYDYNEHPLPPRIQKYAALDALISRIVTEKCLRKLSSSLSPIREPPSDFRIGSQVTVWGGHGRRPTLTGKLVFIGSSGPTTEVKMWGQHIVGKKRALVEVDAVLVPHARPKFYYVDINNPEDTWDEKATLQQLYEDHSPLIILTQTCHLEMKILPETEVTDENTTNATSTIIQNSLLNIQTGTLTSTPSLLHTQEPEDSQGVDCVRSRDKSDIFHQLKLAPLGRTAAAPYIMALLVCATFDMDEDDYKNLDSVLTQKGITDHVMHFYYNREYWKERVRMTTPTADEHASRLTDVLIYIQNESAYQEYIDDEFYDYMRKYIDKCRNGDFEELADVTTFAFKGKDSNGLNLYWRLKGARGENVHQKLHAGIGPFGIGIKSAHYILLNIIFRYNINTGITRCGEPNFGHPWLFLIDRIQDRIEKIWNCTLYSHHVNVLSFKPTDFVAIGLGPLSYDARFVVQGAPLEHLRGDFRFMAERMKLQCPPMPPSSKEEYTIFNQFVRRHPKPSIQQWEELATIFLSKSDGKTVFPKLPQMLKAHFATWVLNQDIKILGEQVHLGWNSLLTRLQQLRGNAPEAHAANAFAIQASSRVQPESSLQPVEWVPPEVAPHQTQYVNQEQTDSQCFRRCAFWPFCPHTVNVCGGYTRGQCRVMASKTAQERPTAEVLTQARNEKRQETLQPRSCAWYPLCQKKSTECGGHTRKKCMVYGDNGSLSPPSEEEFKKLRNKELAERRKRTRSQQRNNSSS